MSGDALRRYAAELTGESKALRARASQVVRKVAFDTEATAKRLAPVDTGNLRSSITTQVVGDGLTAGVVATASYAYWVENGTSQMAPQPFMGPATAENAPKFYEAMGMLAEAGGGAS